MGTEAPTPAKVPPAWFERLFWRAHRVVHRLSGGRFLWAPGTRFAWGAMRLTTIGRISGRERTVIVGYVDDGPNPVVLAMNGWQEGHPAWWRNLQVHPDVVICLPGGKPQAVRAVTAVGEERERLWKLWGAAEPDLDAYAANRSTDTPVVYFEPRG
jgi:deazaflavin-dependent oxidoreductase (nitroreductase family)